MSRPRIALVSSDAEARHRIAASFDSAPSDWVVELHEHPPTGADVVVLGRDVQEDATGAVREGDGPSGDVVARVRQALIARRGGTVLVTAPGGGAGATSLSLHLVRELSRGGRACLLDLDPGRGAALRLGFQTDEMRSWAVSEEHAEDAAVPVPGGFRLLLATGPGEDAVAGATQAFDRVVVDAPSSEAVGVARRASTGVMVLVPTLPAARRARPLLEEMPSLPWAVVTNRLGRGGETTRIELQEALGRRISLELPCCPALRDAEDDGRLLDSSWTRWRRAVARLARALEPS